MLDHHSIKTVANCLFIVCLGIAVSTCAKQTTEPEVAPEPEVVVPEAVEPAPLEEAQPIEEAMLDTAAMEPVAEDTAVAPVAEPPIEEAMLDTMEAEPEIIEVVEAPPEPEPEVIPPVQEEPPPPPPEPVAEPSEPSIVIMDARSYGEMLESMLPEVIEQRLSDIQVSGTMQQGTTHSGSLRLDERDVINSLAEGMTMPDGTPIKPLPFDLTMQLQLTGDDFDIESQSALDQSLLRAPALWEYGITPREAGLRGMRLSGTLQLTVDGTQRNPVNLAPLDTNILVQSTGRSGAFWLLIIAIIIAVAAVGAYIYYRWQTAPPKPEPKAAKPKEPEAKKPEPAKSEEAEPKEDSDKGQAEGKA